MKTAYDLQKQNKKLSFKEKLIEELRTAELIAELKAQEMKK